MASTSISCSAIRRAACPTTTTTTWYDEHVKEILAGRRLGVGDALPVERVVGAGERALSLPVAVRARRPAGARRSPTSSRRHGTADTTSRRRHRRRNAPGARLVHRDPFGSWNCTQVGDASPTAPATTVRDHEEIRATTTCTSSSARSRTTSPRTTTTAGTRPRPGEHREPGFVSAQRYVAQEIAGSEPSGRSNTCRSTSTRVHVDVADRSHTPHQAARRPAGLVQADQVQELELRTPGQPARTAIALTSHDDDAADVLAGVHVGVALVDIFQGVRASDQPSSSSWPLRYRSRSIGMSDLTLQPPNTIRRASSP